MPDAVLVVFSEPTEGAEDDYNDWYNQHLTEVLDIPGFVAAQRFRVAEGAQLDGFPPPQRRYLALYEIDGEPADPIKILLERVHGGEIVLPPSIQVDSIQAWCYSPIADRVTEVPVT